MPKFAAYAIAKNEEKNVPRFIDAINACNLPIYVLDTGSKDKTVSLLKRASAFVTEQKIEPWRYDVARNAALALVPDDVTHCIRLDLDEEIQKDVYDELFGKALNLTRVNHLFQLDASIPESISYHSCVHSRHDYEWRYAAHELFLPKEGIVEKSIMLDSVLIKHYPPKNRTHTYSKILQAAYDSGEHDDRTTFMLGRDLYFEASYQKALIYLNEYILKFQNNKIERSYAMTLIGKCHRALSMDRSRIPWTAFPLTTIEFNWMMKAYIEYPHRRETCVELAYSALRIKDFQSALEFSKKALKIVDGRYAPNNNPDDWMFKPYEIAMHAAYGLGFVFDALIYGRNALKSVTRDVDRGRIEATLKSIDGV